MLWQVAGKTPLSPANTPAAAQSFLNLQTCYTAKIQRRIKNLRDMSWAQTSSPRADYPANQCDTASALCCCCLPCKNTLFLKKINISCEGKISLVYQSWLWISSFLAPSSSSQYFSQAFLSLSLPPQQMSVAWRKRAAIHPDLCLFLPFKPEQARLMPLPHFSAAPPPLLYRLCSRQLLYFPPLSIFFIFLTS